METDGGRSLQEDCKKFCNAAANVGFSSEFPDTEKAATRFGAPVALQLWGLYMQATQGPWDPQKSNPDGMHGWRNLGHMGMTEAMRKFLEIYEKEDHAVHSMVPEYGVEPAANTQMNESQGYRSVLGLKLDLTDELLDQLAKVQTVKRVSPNEDMHLWDEGANDQEQTANQTQDVHLAASTSQFDPCFRSRDDDTEISTVSNRIQSITLAAESNSGVEKMDEDKEE